MLFFASFMIWGILAATGVFMAATLGSFALTYAWKGTLPIFPLLSAFMVMLFGGLTLWLGEAAFIQLKPTVSNGLFGVMMLAGPAIGTNVLKRAFGDEVSLREEAWQKLSVRAGVFLIGLALLNEVVRHSFGTETWVYFKVFGILPLDALFLASQWPTIQRERKRAARESEKVGSLRSSESKTVHSEPSPCRAALG